jgi:hypothetical protein
MKSKEIQKHIDRVVGTEGIFRIPSWWMHKILSDLVKYCEDNEGASSIKSYIESQLNLIGEEIDGLDERLKNVENHELFEIVSKLPSEPKDNTIYLIPSQNGEDNNVLTEWVYINDSWEKLGEFKVQLDEKLYNAYPVEYYEGPEQPERKVVELGGEKLYGYLGEISIPSDMVEVEGTLPCDIIPTEYYYQSVYEGVLQPYFEYEQDPYLNLYIGNDKYGYTSLKIEPSEDPNNLKWFDTMGLGMTQEGPGGISFAYDAKNWTLHYKASYIMPCNIKVYWLYRAQKLDINLIPDEIKKNEVSLTYAELKSLRDNEMLESGRYYRITDFVTTTTQFNTRSAEHPFDVVVLALNESNLAENAYAVPSKRDKNGYFKNSKLSAWKLWYCLDNDTNRFVWADTDNGKGVIYRMIDEFGNDCPYDFKNIQYNYSSDAEPGVVYWYYTFNSDTRDASLRNEQGNKCYNNTINSYYTYKGAHAIQQLNDIYFVLGSLNSYTHNNYFGNNCNDMRFGSDCHDNSFGNSCGCITFGSYCYANSFGNGCVDIFIGNRFRHNSFGNSCTYITFGSDCNANSFGNNCKSMAFGSYCNANSFGNDCCHNYFNVVSTENMEQHIPKNNCYNNHFDNGCCYNYISTSSQVSNAKLQNIHVSRGVCGHSTDLPNVINIDMLNTDYEITVAKNSKGEIKIYCEADLIA